MEQRHKDLWDTIINFSMHAQGVQEGDEREKSPEKIVEEVKGKNISTLLKNISLTKEKAQQIQSKLNIYPHHSQSDERQRDNLEISRGRTTDNVQSSINVIYG